MTDVTIPSGDEVLRAVKDELAVVLEEDVLATVKVEEITADTAVLALPLDSLALMALITRLEDRYEVYIPEAEAYAFERVGQLVEFIRGKRAVKQARLGAQERG